MKYVLKFIVASFLLLSMTACNQEKVQKTANQTKNNVISATSNAPKNPQKQNTIIQTDNQTAANGAICNTPGRSKDAYQIPVTVTETLDGNTIKVIFNGKEETVKYLLIKSPTQKKASGCEQPYANDAKSRNKQLVHSGKVTIEFEFGKSNIDQDGHLLAYVFVNGTSIQETLLKEGLARLDYDNQQKYKYLIPFISAQTSAKNKQLSIWSKPDYVTDNGFMPCENTNT